MSPYFLFRDAACAEPHKLLHCSRLEVAAKQTCHRIACRRCNGFARLFNLIFSAYKDYPPESLIIIRSNSFLLRLPRRRPLLRSHLDTDSTLLLDFICAQKEVSRKEIQDFLGVTQTTANLRITTLIEGGSLEKIGARPSTRYRVTAPIE